MTGKVEIAVFRVLWITIGSILLALFFHLGFLPSKAPEVLGLYSKNKFWLMVGLLIVWVLSLFLMWKVKLSQNRTILFSGKIKHIYCLILRYPFSPYFLFLGLASMLSIFLMQQNVIVTGDMQLQGMSLLHYQAGFVDTFNSYLSFDVHDWSKVNIERIVWWPPGVLYVLHFLSYTGMDLGFSYQVSVFLSFIIGGVGFLYYFKLCRIRPPVLLVIAFCIASYLVTRGGFNYSLMMSSDYLGYSIFPWFMVGVHIYLKNYSNWSFPKLCCVAFILFLLLGFTYWIKNSWFVYSAALCVFVKLSYLFREHTAKRYIRPLFVSTISVISFIFPVVTLELYNLNATGTSAITVANTGENSDGEWYEQNYGSNYSNSTKGFQLISSILLGPGWLFLGHDFFTDFSFFFCALLDQLWISSLFVDFNLLVLSFKFVGIIGIFVLFYLYKILSNKTFAPPYWQFITISIVSSLLLGCVSWKFGSFNFIMNYESRYKLLFFTLGDALIIIAMMSKRFTGTAKGRDIIWMIFLGLFFFYPLIGKAQDVYIGIENNFGTESKNGIYLEDPKSKLLQEKLEKAQSKERRNVVVAYKCRNMLALNLALPVHFIDDSKDLDNLMQNYQTSGTIRIIFIQQGNDSFNDLNLVIWHETLRDISLWKKVVETNQIEIRYVDSQKTF